MVAIKPFPLRMPPDMRAEAEAEVQRRRATTPGASLNDFLCEALAAYLAQLRKEEG